MTAPTKHAENARRISGFVHQTMHDRGLTCQRLELDVALVEITPEQLRQVHAGASELARGGEGRDAMTLLAALRTVCARATRSALSDAGVLYRADVLLPLASAAATTAAFSSDLARLRRPDCSQEERQRSQQALLALCGPLNQADLLLREAPPTAAPSQDAPPPRGSNQAPSSSAKAARQPRMQVKVFGKSAALTWESAPLRARSSAEKESAAPLTFMVEGAKACGDNSYDWAAKIIFACSQRELPQLLAVLLGWHLEAEFKFHGDQAQKRLSLKHQESGLYVQLHDTGATVGVPVLDADRYALAMLVLNVMAHNDPSADAQTVLAVCRDVMRAPVSTPRAGI